MDVDATKPITSFHPISHADSNELRSNESTKHDIAIPVNKDDEPNSDIAYTDISSSDPLPQQKPEHRTLS